MAENREERTPYLGLLALMASNAGGGPSPNAEGYGQPYWSPYALDAYLAALHDAPRVGTVLISPPGSPPLVALSAGAGSVRAGRTLEVAQTFVDEYGRETLPSTVASIYTGAPLADPAAAATLGTPYSSVVSGFTGGLLEVWYSWVDANAGETLVGPVASVELPYLAFGTYNRVEVTLPVSPTAAGAYGAFVYVRHGSSGNIVQAEQITGTDTTCVLAGTWINCFQSLPQFNTTNASNGLNISQDVSVTAPAEAVLTRFYLRAQGETWYSGDRRLRIADVDEWDPATVTYPLLYTGALAELAPGYPPTVEQVKAIRQIDLATEVTGSLAESMIVAALARDLEVAVLLGGPYVLSGLLVEAQAVPDMTVKIKHDASATNYSTNPTANAGAWWTSDAVNFASTKEISPPVAFPGGIASCNKWVHSATASPYGQPNSPITVAEGEVWILSAYVHCSALAGDVLYVAGQTNLRGWTDASVYFAVSATNSDFVRFAKTITIGAGETTLTPLIVVAAGTGTFYVTGLSAVKEPTLTPYFDGSYPNCAWTGTADASTSVRGDGWAISDERIWNPLPDFSIAIAAAHATLARIDIVCVNASGAIVSSSEDAACKGTAAASPVAPSTPTHYVLLATVSVPAADITIETAQITDSRTLHASLAQLDIDTDAHAASTTSHPPRATNTEINTGTDTNKVVTPDALAGSYAGTKSMALIVVADDADVSAADGKLRVPIPPALAGMNMVSAQAGVTTPGTTNATTVDVYNVTDVCDMLSTAISIASGASLGTAGTVDTSRDDVAAYDVLRIDVTTASTTNPKGLWVVLEFRLP